VLIENLKQLGKQPRFLQVLRIQKGRQASRATQYRHDPFDLELPPSQFVRK